MNCGLSAACPEARTNAGRSSHSGARVAFGEFVVSRNRQVAGRTQIVSTSTPPWYHRSGVRYCRVTVETVGLTHPEMEPRGTPEVHGRQPDRHQRFGNFATVPLPDVEGAVSEAEHALDEIDADGVVPLSNYEGVHLGDAK
ncbi:amidohydrolase [Streptomyces olivochromogenes]|uniref:Amidohydrolase n=1 Tax=Streptomyces olivochromogenes TaxID=1963 RepID=A0A286PG74_STROL|nr:amidohydrolase [Streptomyces olivochromogenes]